MDVDLPGISGLEVIQEMQKLSADAQYIILSAYNIFSYAQKALKMGVHEYLLKPCRTEELVAAVHLRFLAWKQSGIMGKTARYTRKSWIRSARFWRANVFLPSPNTRSSVSYERRYASAANV